MRKSIFIGLSLMLFLIISIFSVKAATQTAVDGFEWSSGGVDWGGYVGGGETYVWVYKNGACTKVTQSSINTNTKSYTTESACKSANPAVSGSTPTGSFNWTSTNFNNPATPQASDGDSLQIGGLNFNDTATSQNGTTNSPASSGLNLNGIVSHQSGTYNNSNPQVNNGISLFGTGVGFGDDIQVQGNYEVSKPSFSLGGFLQGLGLLPTAKDVLTTPSSLKPPIPLEKFEVTPKEIIGGDEQTLKITWEAPNDQFSKCSPCATVKHSGTVIWDSKETLSLIGTKEIKLKYDIAETKGSELEYKKSFCIRCTPLDNSFSRTEARQEVIFKRSSGEETPHQSEGSISLKANPTSVILGEDKKGTSTLYWKAAGFKYCSTMPVNGVTGWIVDNIEGEKTVAFTTKGKYSFTITCTKEDMTTKSSKITITVSEGGGEGSNKDMSVIISPLTFDDNKGGKLEIAGNMYGYKKCAITSESFSDLNITEFKKVGEIYKAVGSYDIPANESDTPQHYNIDLTCDGIKGARAMVTVPGKTEKQEDPTEEPGGDKSPICGITDSNKPHKQSKPCVIKFLPNYSKINVESVEVGNAITGKLAISNCSWGNNSGKIYIENGFIVDGYKIQLPQTGKQIEKSLDLNWHINWKDIPLKTRQNIISTINSQNINGASVDFMFYSQQCVNNLKCTNSNTCGYSKEIMPITFVKKQDSAPGSGPEEGSESEPGDGPEGNDREIINEEKGGGCANIVQRSLIISNKVIPTFTVSLKNINNAYTGIVKINGSINIDDKKINLPDWQFEAAQTVDTTVYPFKVNLKPTFDEISKINPLKIREVSMTVNSWAYNEKTQTNDFCGARTYNLRDLNTGTINFNCIGCKALCKNIILKGLDWEHKYDIKEGYNTFKLLSFKNSKYKIILNGCSNYFVYQESGGWKRDGNLDLDGYFTNFYKEFIAEGGMGVDIGTIELFRKLKLAFTVVNDQNQKILITTNKKIKIITTPNQSVSINGNSLNFGGKNYSCELYISKFGLTKTGTILKALSHTITTKSWFSYVESVYEIPKEGAYSLFYLCKIKNSDIPSLRFGGESIWIR